MDEFMLCPDPDDPRLTETVRGVDHEGRAVETAVVYERPLTLFLNDQEIVTMMTIGDYPDYLAVGYLLNQNMLRPDDVISGIDYDEELEVVVVRTGAPPTTKRSSRRRSGRRAAPRAPCSATSWSSSSRSSCLRMRSSRPPGCTRSPRRSTPPSLYLKAGAIHGCVLCEEDRPLLYGRTSAATTPSTRSRATCS